MKVTRPTDTPRRLAQRALRRDDSRMRAAFDQVSRAAGPRSPSRPVVQLTRAAARWCTSADAAKIYRAALTAIASGAGGTNLAGLALTLIDCADSRSALGCAAYFRRHGSTKDARAWGELTALATESSRFGTSRKAAARIGLEAIRDGVVADAESLGRAVGRMMDGATDGHTQYREFIADKAAIARATLPYLWERSDHALVGLGQQAAADCTFASSQEKVARASLDALVRQTPLMEFARTMHSAADHGNADRTYHNDKAAVAAHWSHALTQAQPKNAWGKLLTALLPAAHWGESTDAIASSLLDQWSQPPTDAALALATERIVGGSQSKLDHGIFHADRCAMVQAGFKALEPLLTDAASKRTLRLGAAALRGVVFDKTTADVGRVVLRAVAEPRPLGALCADLVAASYAGHTTNREYADDQVKVAANCMEFLGTKEAASLMQFFQAATKGVTFGKSFSNAAQVVLRAQDGDLGPQTMLSVAADMVGNAIAGKTTDGRQVDDRLVTARNVADIVIRATSREPLKRTARDMMLGVMAAVEGAATAYVAATLEVLSRQDIGRGDVAALGERLLTLSAGQGMEAVFKVLQETSDDPSSRRTWRLVAAMCKHHHASAVAVLHHWAHGPFHGGEAAAVALGAADAWAHQSMLMDGLKVAVEGDKVAQKRLEGALSVSQSEEVLRPLFHEYVDRGSTVERMAAAPTVATTLSQSHDHLMIGGLRVPRKVDTV